MITKSDFENFFSYIDALEIACVNFFFDVPVTSATISIIFEDKLPG